MHLTALCDVRKRTSKWLLFANFRKISAFGGNPVPESVTSKSVTSKSKSSRIEGGWDAVFIIKLDHPYNSNPPLSMCFSETIFIYLHKKLKILNVKFSKCSFLLGKLKPYFSWKFSEIWTWLCQSGRSSFLDVVELISERYITIPCQEKNPDQKILFFHGEIRFSKFEIEQNFLKFAK